jgi:3-hydroxyisobutyrate dehydrogenase
MRGRLRRMIAILGTGLLGSGFTQSARKRGEDVHVWNRSPARAKALESVGANAFADAASAVRGASRVHIVVSDDAAVDSVLGAAKAGLEPGALVIDHSTTSTAGARSRTARTDITYVHAPVFMGPKNAAESTGLMLLSGDAARVERVKPLVAPMTGKVVELGDRVDAAAAFKLMGNLFLMAMTAGCADMLGLAKAMGVPLDAAAGLFEHFNPGAMAGPRTKAIAAGKFDPPSWELAMARKDARLMQAEASASGVELGVLPAIAVWMDRAIADGDSAKDWTVIAKQFV